MTAVAGLRGTGDWGTDERPKNFREGILFFQPNGNSPIFGLTSKAGKKTVDDPEFSWWNEGQTLVRLRVAGELASGDTVVTVDSVDPTSVTLGANYGTAKHLKPGDLLLVEPTADNATFNHELVEVVNVISDTQFSVTRGAGGTSAATIANDVFLLLIGSAYAEGTGAPRATSRNPIKFSNYTQIFKDSYELSGTADETKARTGNAWSNDKKRKSYDHARAIELSILYGRKAEIPAADNGKPKRYMGGLRSFLPAANVTVFSTAVGRDSFLDAVSPLFQFETGAGDTRIAFMGRMAANELSKIFAEEVQYNVSNKVTVYGLDFQEFNFPVGRVLVKVHPLMSQHTGTGGLRQERAAYILDFDALKYVSLKNRDTKTKDDVQNKDEDVRRGFIQTECSIMVDYGGLTMGYLGNISAT